MAPTGHLPAPLIGSYDWQFRAACRQSDTDTFYLESLRNPTRARLEAEAKAVCASCPVVQQCLDHALRADEPYGIWGGQTVQERRELRNRTQRRPLGTRAS